MVIEFQYLQNVLQNEKKRAGVTWFKIRVALREIENLSICLQWNRESIILNYEGNLF